MKDYHKITQSSEFALGGGGRGEVPLTYVALPLVAGSLSKANCQRLLMKLSLKLQQWTSVFLSFTGRLQLIKSKNCSLAHF